MIIPIPTHNEPELTYEEEITANENQRIKQYLDCPDWKCPKCGSSVFGRCETCPYCKNRAHQ